MPPPAAGRKDSGRIAAIEACFQGGEEVVARSGDRPEQEETGQNSGGAVGRPATTRRDRPQQEETGHNSASRAGMWM